MTPPAFFAVAYAINPWMDVTAPVDVQVAQAQWEHLHQTYLRLGHSVDLIEPISGLPDMVYTANGGFHRARHRRGRPVPVPRTSW